MCFAPQRRALFSTSEPPKVVREWCALYILTSKCASRYNGVHFFDISTSKSGPIMVCFVHFVHFDFDMCFALQRRAIFHLSSGQLAPHPPLPPEPQIIGKTQCFATSYLFAHLHLLSSDSFSSTLLSSNLSLLSALLCFSSVHIVGSFTSKLPSNSGSKNFKNMFMRRNNQKMHGLSAWCLDLSTSWCVHVCVCCPRVEKFVQRQDDDLFPFSVCKVTLVRLAVGARKQENTSMTKHIETLYHII